MSHPMPSDELCAKAAADFRRREDEGLERESYLYQRARDLPKHLAVWPKELRDYSVGGTEAIIKRIQKVLRATYYAALRQHWSYDLNRHIALLTALRAEKRRLASLIAERRKLAEAAE